MSETFDPFLTHPYNVLSEKLSIEESLQKLLYIITQNHKKYKLLHFFTSLIDPSSKVVTR